jgi:sirohydrochlorin cobaltochelatase
VEGRFCFEVIGERRNLLAKPAPTKSLEPSTIHYPLVTLSSAYLLVSHGSRDPRPQIAIERLAQQLALQLHEFLPVTAPVVVATAQLELAEQPLHRQICDFAANFSAQGLDRIVLLPLFLLPGVHVMDDIPTEVAIAQQELSTLVQIIVAPFLGSAPNLVEAFAQNRFDLPAATTILGHGSRRSGGNTPIERLATDLDLEVAYWSIAPSLTDRVTALVATGATEIGILPYFLFAGGITDAIADMVTELSHQFPQVKFVLGEPLGDSSHLVAILGKIISSID